MVRWAYQTFFLTHDENFDKWANRWGEQGWEIYHIGPLIQRHHQKDWGRDVFMKRPKGRSRGGCRRS